MVVHDVLNHGDAVAVTLPNEMPVFVAAAGAGFNAEVVGIAIAPTEGAAKFRQRQQFDGVHAELAKVPDELQSIAQITRAGLAKPQRANVQLVDDKIFQAGGHWQAGREFRGPELLRRNKVRSCSGRGGREISAESRRHR